MGYIKKALIVLVLAMVTYQVVTNVFFDWYISHHYAITKENTSGKKVLITGSSKGIGEALAYVYAKAGAHVAITARSDTLLKKVAKKCLEIGAASVKIVTGDFSIPNEATKVVDKATAALGGLDIVIANHVHPYDFHTASHSVRNIEKSFRVNFHSYIDLALAALPALKQSAGDLIFVSTIAARMPMPYCYDYCLAKRGVEAFSVALRQELAINGSSVHVGLAVLGLIDTASARVAMPTLVHESVQLPYTPVEETAHDIAKIPLAKVRELLTPWWNRPTTMLSILNPGSTEDNLRKVVTKR